MHSASHTKLFRNQAPTVWGALLSLLLFALALLSSSTPALADSKADSTQAARPKVGLVLGGGGARGSAHVGVLKVLEELRIPVDYIAGNSMGAIVGGLYASGMTPAEIAHELKTIDWVDVFEDDPPRPERSFRRKRDDDLYLVKPKMGFSDGEVKFPMAFIQGQKFDLQLSRLTLHVADVHDFGALPIPFRAVAADIETGREVVLKSGDLARAIRASMAVPGAFDPVEIDGKLLVDGLVANNVPVNVARDMGADILIVVDVGSGLFKREDIKGVVDVVGQLTNILSERNVEMQLATLKPQDILIKPDLGKLGSGDFDKAGVGIDKGEKAAREMLKELSRLSVSPDVYQRHMARRGARAETPVIEFVRLDNKSRLADEVILSHFTLKPGEVLDNARLDRDIGMIYGLDVFESVRYEVVKEDGRTGVVLHAKEKSWGPNYLQFGLKLADNFQGDSSYNLGVLYTMTAINDRNGELRFGLQVGEDLAGGAEWYQPLDVSSLWFVNTGVSARREQFSIYEGDDIVSEYRIVRAGFELSGGRELGRWGEARVGYRWAKGEADVNIGDPALDDYEFTSGQLYARFYVDTLDNVFVPTQGNKGRIEYATSREALGSDSDYDQARLAWSRAFTRGRSSLVGAVRFDYSLDDDTPPESLFRIGGFLNLSGLRPNQLSGPYAGEIALVAYRRILDAKLLPAYIGGSIEYGNVWQDKDDIAFDNAILNGSLFLGADTPIGPLYTGFGFAEGGRYTVFLYLGPAF
jgi:NTE family protein